MKVFIFVIGFLIFIFLGVSRFMTQFFGQTCGLSVTTGEVQSCRAGFQCVSRSSAENATGSCVFGTDAITWYQLNYGKTPLDELESDFELLDRLQDIDSCEVLQAEISEQLEAANYCEAASDCVVKQMSCPFGCTAMVNRGLVERVELMTQIYSGKSCESCVYKCAAPPQTIDCIDNRCVETQVKDSLLSP